ncbi:hypothetical protein GGI20_003900 [Coemansia sp. BCRC 34301]|nr:hypothetical protein GGI20_003900 [Coemansia sp. BCRC 34301]
MRSFSVFIVLACILALVNATYIQFRKPTNNAINSLYEVQDTKCYQVDPRFSTANNEVIISGYPTRVFANADCTYDVGLIYSTFGKWVNIPRPIRSFSVAAGY